MRMPDTDFVGKFQNPEVTAKGEPRASVSYNETKTLWFNTGTLCNIECINCYIESSPTNDRLVYLTAADVSPYLDELDAAGEQNIEIGFTGGEPFMAPEMIDILRLALDRGHRVLMLTNAMQPMMRPRVKGGLMQLRETYGDQLVMRVSLDHFSETLHDQERGEGSFGLAMKGLRWLSENGFSLALAGRTIWGEDEDFARQGYADLIAREGLEIDPDNSSELVLFPEMRPFFLENAGLFAVNNAGPASGRNMGQTELFFSRRIGISDSGTQIPILAGARMSGKMTNSTTVGLLNMQTEAVDGLATANNFTVARLRRELTNRSNFGGIFVNRQGTGGLVRPDDYNRSYAVDGRWGIGQNGTVQGFVGRTQTPGLTGRDHALNFFGQYDSEMWRVISGYQENGEDFNPEVGFIRRQGFKKLDGGVFYTWRPEKLFKVQEMQPHITFNRFWDIDTGFIETSLVHMDNFVEFDDSSTAITAWNVRKEGVTREFTISGVPVLPGSYDWHELSLNYNSNNSAPGTVGFRLQKSGFFGGHLLQYGPTAGFRRGETLNARFSLTRNHIDLPMGVVVTNLVSSRVAYNFSTRVFAQGLVQYNDSVDLWSVNLRLGWLQAANTGFFLVYNDTDGLGDFVPDGSGRSLILKYSRLFDLLQ